MSSIQSTYEYFQYTEHQQWQSETIQYIPPCRAESVQGVKDLEEAD